MLQRSSRAFSRRRRRSGAVGLVLVAGVGALVLGWLVGLVSVPGFESPIPGVQAQVGGVPSARLEAARAALASVPVKGRAPKTGYARTQFGQAWADADRNGCDTRNDILGRDLVQIVFKPGTRDCAVQVVTDPFSKDDEQKAVALAKVVQSRL